MNKTYIVKLSGIYLNYINDAVINIDDLFKQEKRHYNRRRCAIEQNIKDLKKKQLQTLLVLATHSNELNYEKRFWKLDRTKSFWEVDCQMLNDEGFKSNFRMNRHTFKVLCSKLGCLKKEHTRFRPSILLEKRVAISVYALGSSAEYRSIANLFGIGKSTVCVILLQFCKVVWAILLPLYLNFLPLCRDRIEECIRGFETLGAIGKYIYCLNLDGCHIEVHPNSSDALDYFNYKGWYSTILFALVDYRYRFLYINIGSPGRCNDSQIFENSLLRKHLDENQLLKKMSKRLCGVEVPVVIMGDSAFRLSNNVMKPYPFNADNNDVKKNYNYMLSKSRRVVENAFGQLKARFRRIGKGVDNNIKNVNDIEKASCVLHNFLNENNDYVNQQWLQEVQDTQQPKHTTYIYGKGNGEEIRQAISEYIATGLGAGIGLESEMDCEEFGAGGNSLQSL